MLNRIDGYWMDLIAPGPGEKVFLATVPIFFTISPFPPGTNVYASISLSEISTSFGGSDPDPKFSVVAKIISWSVYQPDGTESQPQPGGMEIIQNAVGVENCARITFMLAGDRVAASAQINIFSF